MAEPQTRFAEMLDAKTVWTTVGKTVSECGKSRLFQIPRGISPETRDATHYKLFLAEKELQIGLSFNVNTAIRINDLGISADLDADNLPTRLGDHKARKCRNVNELADPIRG